MIIPVIVSKNRLAIILPAKYRCTNTFIWCLFVMMEGWLSNEFPVAILRY